MSRAPSIARMLREEERRTAIHEAGHAVVGHLVGVAIDRVAIHPRGGYSRPVRDPVAATGDKLWAEANGIIRKLMLADWPTKWEPRCKWRYVLRKGARRLKNGTVRGTPAPQELVDRMDGLRKRACAIWKKSTKSRDQVKDLMHTLGGPVADTVFFNEPFEAPRTRLHTKAELKARGPAYTSMYGRMGYIVGNAGAATDFRLIRNVLKHIDNSNWKETREFYRHKTEQLVRQHRATIERVAKALLRHKTLSGAELTKLIEQSRNCISK